MSKLTVTIEIPDIEDTSMELPRDVAVQMVDVISEWANVQGYAPVDLISAKWEDD